MKKIYLLLVSVFVIGATQTNAQCSADFMYFSNNLTVNFQDSSYYSPNVLAPVQQDWNFGDGLVGYGTNPVHTYATAGTYNVSLTIYDSLWTCFDTISKVVTVTGGITPPPSSCNASFTQVKDSSVAYGVILYNTSSNFASHSYSWDFGDGISGSGRTPIHQYQNFGSYIVCLTITDSMLNCTSTYCDTIGMDTLGNLKSGFGITVQNLIPVGLTETIDLKSVNLYPNPATNQIALDLTGVKSTTDIRIMDISGRIVVEQLNQNPGMVKNFEIASLESGLYFMVLNNGSAQEIKKFIKQ